jgi:hypothetical protein
MKAADMKLRVNIRSQEVISMRTRELIVVLALSFGLAALAPTALARSGAAGRMGSREINERWQELRKKGWSKAEMGRALQISRREPGLFDIVVQMKGKVPMGALKKSFEICEGKPELVREFWNYVEQGFAPKEVAEVISTFPPNEQQRWLYFKYRAGGAEALQKRGKNGDEQQQKRPQPKGYSSEEVMGIFKGVRFDVKLVKEYFSLRQKGHSPQQAWAKVRETVRDQIEKEKAEARKKKEEEEKKRQERAEAREKLREQAEKERKEKKEEDKEKEDRGEVISLEGLGALVEEGEKKETEEEGDTSEKKEQTDEQREKSNGDKDGDKKGGDKDEGKADSAEEENKREKSDSESNE